MRNLFILLISTCAVLQGCIPSVYLSDSVNTPNLTQKKDGSIDGYLGIDHMELQGSCSPSSNIGIFANGYSTYNSSQSSGTDVTPSLFIEGAIGYYHPIRSSNIYFDLYGGGGTGERNYNGGTYLSGVTEPTMTMNTSYNKLFLQSSIYYKQNRIEFSISDQISDLYYNYMNVTVYTFDFYHPIQGFTMPVQSQNYSHLSLFDNNLAFTIKYGWKKFKFIAQVAVDYTPNAPYPTSQSNSAIPVGFMFNTRTGAINLGIQYSF